MSLWIDSALNFKSQANLKMTVIKNFSFTVREIKIWAKFTYPFAHKRQRIHSMNINVGMMPHSARVMTFKIAQN